MRENESKAEVSNDQWKGIYEAKIHENDKKWDVEDINKIPTPNENLGNDDAIKIREESVELKDFNKNILASTKNIVVETKSNKVNGGKKLILGNRK